MYDLYAVTDATRALIRRVFRGASVKALANPERTSWHSSVKKQTVSVVMCLCNETTQRHTLLLHLPAAVTSSKQPKRRRRRQAF